jgi:hypothetical protein
LNTITVTLASTSAVSLAALAALGSTVPSGAFATAQQQKKLSHIVEFWVYPEDGNSAALTASPGSARIAFDNEPSAGAAPHGTPLIPGIQQHFAPGGGGSAIYDFNQTYIAGATGDVFQIHFGRL